MNQKKYKLIYADPAWAFNNKNTGGNLKSGSANHYNVMSIDDIKALPIGDLADDNCLLAMWWVGAMPAEALAVVEAWGFKLKTMTGFNWVKLTKKGLRFFGMGFYTRQGSENCLFAVKGKPEIISHSVRAVVQHSVGAHSEKPDIFREKLLQLVGNVPRLELFAREKVKGWDCWGNEIESDINISEVVNEDTG